MYLKLSVQCIPPSLWLLAHLSALDCMRDETGGASVRSMFYLLDCSHLAANMCSFESLALLKGQAWQFAVRKMQAVKFQM